MFSILSVFFGSILNQPISYRRPNVTKSVENRCPSKQHKARANWRSDENRKTTQVPVCCGEMAPLCEYKYVYIYIYIPRDPITLSDDDWGV